ncbi:hypothetical protein BP6252_06026 [Coleophoma cylindrospora]|uniref:Uncharacterized protein n=1 Tax=Coleophoma cylindrospora TaxID=1849047 RepID=A0A3D8RLW4_9HELO|nr:hypothetical protein BP6252_06026 [Coleophoma cylindrospora]
MSRDRTHNANDSPDARADSPRHRRDKGGFEQAAPLVVRPAPRWQDPVAEKLEIDHGEAQFADLQRQLEGLPPEGYAGTQYPSQTSEADDYPRRRQDEIEDYDDSSARSSRGSSRSSGTTPRKKSTSSPLKKGYHEARHYAGGIIHHPAESTEHFSILRHSHGLVFYQGIHTHVAISVFSDAPLPPERTYWLKAKNWSTTAKNKATFRQQTTELLNVTPVVAVKPEQIDPNEERAWQRDITEFERRTRRGYRSKHILRETVVIRIPTESGDGYFQIALTAGEGEDAVCISPTFRILSVSPNMGGVSGAHWATLPFEVGAMALSWQARSAIVAAAVLPVKSAAKSRAKPSIHAHAAKARKATMVAYGASGAADKVEQQIEAFNKRYSQEREAPFSRAAKIDDDYVHGPKQPYPIRFIAHCNVPREEPVDWHIIPSTKLDGVADSVMHQLCGYYFGWCSVPSKKHDADGRVHRHSRWHQAIIVVFPIEVNKLERVTMYSATKKNVEIQILVDDHDQPVDGTEVKVEVFGCIRPWDQELESMLAEDMDEGEELAFETAITNEMGDIEWTRKTLDHPSWYPEAVFQKEEEEAAEPKPKVHGIERLKQEYAAKRLAVQKKIDKVPAHMLGVRMPVDRHKDKAVDMNGYYIRR